MNILISNDDGYLAPGIQELARHMKRFGHVTVVAPEQNHSGASNSLTLTRPLSIRQVQDDVYFINGTPSDCVHIALTGLLKEKPDLVAAAMEGYLFGCPSFAFSQVKSGWSYLDSAAQTVERIIENYLDNPLPAPFLLNVNIPNTTIDRLNGVVVTRLGRRHSAQSVIEQINPRGEKIYWLGAAGDAKDDAQGTDFWATSHGYVSMTPLQVDMTNYATLDSVKNWWNKFPA